MKLEPQHSQRQHQHQKGYLLLITVVLIVIIGMIGSLIAYMFAGSAGSTGSVAQSNAAFYIATSGLEIAKRDILVNSATCSSINGTAKYTNASLFNGQFTVTGAVNVAATTLSSAINSSTTSIPLVSTSGLYQSGGSIMIDSEAITYASISSNTLLNVQRGAAATTASSHLSGASVTQNQCALTAVGGIPTIAAPAGKRTLRQFFSGVGLSFGGLGSFPSAMTPVLVSAQHVNITGNSRVINPSVSSTSANFAGSTIISGNDVTLNGNAATILSDGVSSQPLNKGGLKQDVKQPFGPIANNGNTLFGYYFNTTKAQFQATANQSYNSGNIIGATGKTIWFAGDLNLSGNGNIGSPTAPVILIVTGNLNLNGNINIFGFAYSMIALSMHGNCNITGGTASEGAINLNGNNIITYSTSILTLLNLLNQNTSIHYLLPATTQEVFN